MNDALDQLFTQRADSIFMIAAVLALPWIFAIINRMDWSSAIKSLFVIAACFAVAGGWLVFHEFNGSKWATYAAVLIGGTQLIYFFFKPGVKELESKTG